MTDVERVVFDLNAGSALGGTQDLLAWQELPMFVTAI